jgi:4-alpha-glucanotransferase
LNQELAELAQLFGVQTSYVDMRQNRVDADPESVLLVLQALGTSTRQMDDVPQALKEKREELQRRAAEPVIVAWDGQLPSQSPGQPANSQITFVLEDGTHSEWPPKGALPHGYHSLHIKSDEGTTTSLVISAPVQAHFPLKEKAWGTFAPLYALHSDTSAGAGDLADLRSLIDWTRGHGGRVVSTLPLLAAYLEGDRFEPSPYSPVSRLFWNEFYIDLSASGIQPAPVPELIDYRTAMQEKRRILEGLARAFFENSNAPRFAEFQNFVLKNPEVTEYARFRARVESPRENSEQYYLYAQWLVQTQLREMADDSNRTGMLLYLDLPLGLHRESFDAWRYPELFVKGISGGAPPDPVFTTGQNWSFQPIHPQAMRADGYRYAIAYIRNHLQYAKLLRIDHVMGLHRLFWIPDGLTGDRGLYVEYPADEMYAILSLESHRAGAGIVGENLGVVPPVVNESMSRHNVRQLYVAQYETAVDSGPEALRTPPAGSVASLNTHDLFPFQGFLNGTDIDERLRLNFITPDEAAAEHNERKRIGEALTRFAGQNTFEGCIDFLAKSHADIVLLNLEDLWGETNAQNVPATTKEHPNWKRRMRYSIELLRRLALPQGLMKRGTTDVTSQRS